MELFQMFLILNSQINNYKTLLPSATVRGNFLTKKSPTNNTVSVNCLHCLFCFTTTCPALVAHVDFIHLQSLSDKLLYFNQ